MRQLTLTKYKLPVVGGSAVIIAYIACWLSYAHLPARVVFHWSISGQADRSTGRFWGALLLPLTMLGTYLLLVFIPRIDPKAKNIEKFSRQWTFFISFLELLLLYIYLLSLYWNLGHHFDFKRFMALGLGLFLFGIARLVAAAKQNYTIGIRTPWTLANEKVWERTHVLGARLFLFAGCLSLLGLFWPAMALGVVLGSIIGVTLLTVIYSYVYYRQETTK